MPKLRLPNPFTLIIILLLWFSTTGLYAQEYLWPTDASPYLSSTFGETRSAHFHAGLDIKTWGREGYRVFASREGIIHRLVISERGYGKAIYLKHPDNTYTVYAHLQRFHPDIQALADSIRLTNYSTQLDVVLDSLNLKVEQREIIGYSGSTGIGPPHLHFEVRESLQNPVNALETNLTIPDELPPVFSGLIVEPISPESGVNGQPVSKLFKPRKTGDIYDYGTIGIKNKVGLAVNVYDKANKVYNSYAAYSLALVHQSDTLYLEKLRSYRFDEAWQMFLNRIAPFRCCR